MRWFSPRETRTVSPSRAAQCAVLSFAAARRCPTSPCGLCLPARLNGRSHAVMRAAGVATTSAARRNCAAEPVAVNGCVSGYWIGCLNVNRSRCIQVMMNAGRACLGGTGRVKY